MLGFLFSIATFVGVQAPPVVVDAPAQPKRVCRSERSTGSRVVKQICRTAADHAKEDLAAKNKLRLGNQAKGPPDAFKGPTGN
jgi:hypothetical protein